jgi:hypothetical protein
MRREVWMPAVLYQCRRCGGVVSARERRAHLNDRHHNVAAAFNAKQVAAAFTTTIDPMHPGRTDKWGYTDTEIRRVIPGLEPAPEEEVSDAAEEPRQCHA